MKARPLKLLVVHDPPNVVDPLRGSIFPRNEELDATFVETLDHARDKMRAETFDAVLLRRGLKRLGLQSFHRLFSSRARLLVIDDDVPGFERVEGDTAEHVVDQVFALLGIARSAVFDRKVLGRLGRCGAATIEQIEFEGIDEPVLRARIDTAFLAEELPMAQRIAQLQGRGLAPTLEVFWDDPRPHLLHVVPPGLTLRRMIDSRKPTGFGAPTNGPGEADALGLALLRVLVEGVLTLHEADVSCGRLELSSVWLTHDGDALLLARGMANLTREERTPGATAPGEFRLGARERPPVPTGDAFRLGAALFECVVGHNPFFGLAPRKFAALQWQVERLSPFALLNDARSLAAALCAPQYEGPTGAGLRAVIDRFTPANARTLVQRAVQAAASVPDRGW